MRRTICCIAISALGSGGAAGEGITARNSDDLITGVVIDQALTLIGHEFYRGFSDGWKESGCVDSRILTIYERPSARWGSLVWVEYQRQMLYRAFLPPSMVKVTTIAQGAAQSVCRRVMEFEAQKALFVDPDLARDEVDW